MRPKARDAEFEDFVRRRRSHLLGTAAVLTAGDHHLAEDLVQGVLVRLYLAWGRATRRGGVDAYARRALVNAFIDHRRRPSVARETVTDTVPDRAAAAAPAAASFGAAEVDAELLAALKALPERMRAAVVLRHVADLSVEDAADALGCSPGTVKSQTARGLAKLRELLPQAAPIPAAPYEGDPT
ncbi:SigE family RNA polymerase sigma factor [Nocardioides daeguensis]|uniref:SigE family RNA polymerase sigma factor n=1 Tax=Nocardioides daeguensis TaxID=908359 RepID=A0ABP6VE78_9ACTN|nr:SigE family RNA polymerase sigma factor [Nocardioides daeguensis]MBV6729369.1 SigE family RNA polymerase sigma factor [Nocardioides daeguensis]MCR1771858.1 SigE family RNA polymerase sigma factor [Nocardioides daeguensis]